MSAHDSGIDVEPQSSDPLLPFQAAHHPPARLTSVDLLRGLTVFCMILVNTSTNGSFTFLRHPAWTGMTFADVIFPTFLFISGVSIPLALDLHRFVSRMEISRHDDRADTHARQWRRITTRKILFRSVNLWLLGFILLNVVPYYAFRWAISPEAASLRVPGVLQRIAVCYLVVALVHVWAFTRGGIRRVWRWWGWRVLFPAVLLVAWAIPTYTLTGCSERVSTFEPPECSAEAYLDTLIFKKKHLYMEKPYDPEGTLSTLTAILTTYIGYLLGVYLHAYPPSPEHPLDLYTFLTQILLLSSIILLPLSYLSAEFIPISKPLWTPSFVLLAGAISVIAFALCTYLSDGHELFKTFLPVRVLIAYGRNPIVIYVLAELIEVGIAVIYAIVTDEDPWGEGGEGDEERATTRFWVAVGKLAWSMFYATMFAPLAWWMDRRGWFIKV